MARILINCPAGAGVVATGHRTQDLDLAQGFPRRSFRCKCGQVHQWDGGDAWAEVGLTDSAKRAYGLMPEARI